ncbi:UNVERIFIED_CONTAM: hypothetical protein PYX00_009547 [Menopon gallinae]|uniref:CMP-sialic acid transporter n=1 Tax=Menopon gallinae TaxID=328185 RepID=A0AAW2HBZ5_9NEOP
MKGRLKSGLDKLSELFPNVTSLLIFIAYMALCVGQGIFVTASRKKGENYDYNTTTVVLFTEITKLFLATGCYLKNGTVKSLIVGFKSNLKVLCLYLVPSFLYCIYNNLAFVNLSHFDPTTYFILLQLRVVMTGVVFQIIFNKKLSKIQWLSLFLLTFGCMVQQIDWNYLSDLFGNHDIKNHQFFSLSLHTMCSCFAGVYNEFLLKDVGANINIFIQNIFMYLDSILWNLAFVVYQGNGMNIFTAESLAPVLKPIVIIVIFNNALTGITTSLFLKNLNSILKTFASALELLFTAVLSWIIFGIAIRFNTIAAIGIVSYSMYVYSQNPVNNRPKQVEEDEEALLEEV